MDVGCHQVESQHSVEDRQQNEAHTDLYEPAPEAGCDHQNMSPQAALGCQGRGGHCLTPTRIGQHQNQHHAHDRCQQQIESVDRQAHTDQCARNRPRHGAQRERQDHAGPGQTMAEVGQGCTDVLREDG